MSQESTDDETDDKGHYVCLLCPTDDQTPIPAYSGSLREVETHINEEHALMARDE